MTKAPSSLKSSKIKYHCRSKFFHWIKLEPEKYEKSQNKHEICKNILIQAQSWIILIDADCNNWSELVNPKNYNMVYTWHLKHCISPATYFDNIYLYIYKYIYICTYVYIFYPILAYKFSFYEIYIQVQIF